MKKFYPWLVLILISLLPLLDFFQPGLPLTHDGQDHVARIANFYQSLVEGHLIPRWAANLNWGYGHPILMFLYPLPSYFSSFFHFLGFSLVESTKIVFGLSFTLSGLLMFLWVNKAWGREAAWVASLLYLFAPYRFVDLYVRGAIGECWAFVWPPLICWFGLKLSQKFKWQYLFGGALSIAALILSHNALALMFLPLILGYFGYLIYITLSKRLITYHLSLITILGFGLSAFFWFPAFFEGKYTLRDIVTADDYTNRFRPLMDFFWSTWDYGGTNRLSVQVGPLHWLAFLGGGYSMFRLIKKKKQERWLIAGLLTAFLVFLLLMVKVSLPIWQTVSLLQKFQFPWRFLTPLVFISALLGGISVSRCSKKKRIWLVVIIALVLGLISKNYWRAQSFLVKPESFYTGVYAGTTDTGESSPRWSVRFMENFPQAPIEVIDGQAEIKINQRLTTEHVYLVKAESETRLVENTLYFPGWFIFIDGQPTEIEFQDPNWRGLMTFKVPSGEHRILVSFGETRLRKLANLVSVLSLLSLVLGGKIINKIILIVKNENKTKG